VPATVDPGYPVVVSAEINGSNQSVETGAVYEWARLVKDEEGAGNGYIIVENYCDANGKPVGKSSALLSVIPVLNDEFTTNTFIITGSDIIRYEDPQTGDTYGVMRIAR